MIQKTNSTDLVIGRRPHSGTTKNEFCIMPRCWVTKPSRHKIFIKIESLVHQLFLISYLFDTVYRILDLPEWASNPQIYLRAIPIISSILFKVFTPKHPFCQSRQHQAIQLWLYLLQFTTYSIGGTAHWFNRHRDSARSHSRFTFDHGSRIFQSLPTKNQSAIC